MDRTYTRNLQIWVFISYDFTNNSRWNFVISKNPHIYANLRSLKQNKSNFISIYNNSRLFFYSIQNYEHSIGETKKSELWFNSENEAYEHSIKQVKDGETKKRKEQDRLNQSSSPEGLEEAPAFLGRRRLWIFGITPPLAIVTSPSNLLNSSSFLTASWMCLGTILVFLLSLAAFPANSNT